jgi:hypothetical protein
MRKTALLALLCLLIAGIAVAQTPTTTPSQDSSAQAQQQQTAPSENPQSTMPPDTAAPPAVQHAPQDTTPPSTPPERNAAPSNSLPQSDVDPNNPAPQENQPALGSRQEATAPSGQTLAAGTEIKAALDTELSSKTTQTGENFNATVISPVRDGNGQVIIPTGSKIVGQVTEVEQGKVLGTVRGAKAKLNMRFNQVQLPSGQSFPIAATLVSVNSTGNKNSKASANEEGEVTSSSTGRNTAKDVGIGAGAGTIAGLIFGSALKGLAIGAIAGGGYVLATNGKDVELPAQTGLLLRLDQNVSVPPGAGNNGGNGPEH